MAASPSSHEEYIKASIRVCAVSDDAHIKPTDTWKPESNIPSRTNGGAALRHGKCIRITDRLRAALGLVPGQCVLSYRLSTTSGFGPLPRTDTSSCALHDAYKFAYIPVNRPAKGPPRNALDDSRASAIHAAVPIRDGLQEGRSWRVEPVVLP